MKDDDPVVTMMNEDIECGEPVEHVIPGLRKCRRPKRHPGNHKPVIQASDIPGLVEAVKKRETS